MAIVVAVLTAISSFAQGGLRFKPLILEQLGYSYATPNGINDSGDVVGTLDNTLMPFPYASSGRAVVWDGETGKGRLLGVPTGYAGTFAFDINNDDVVVGVASISSTSTRAFRYRDGTLDVSLASARALYAINDAGTAVGKGLAGGDPIAVTNSTVLDLNGSTATAGTAYAISSTGKIVGDQRLSSFSQEYHACLFQLGSTPTLFESSAFDSKATGVNSHGLIVGYVGLVIPGQPGVGDIPVRFEGNGYAPLPGGFTAVGTNSAIARAVNDQGWIGGTRGLPTASVIEREAALFIGANFYEPTGLLAPEYAGLFKIHDIYAINNRGQLAVAASQDIDGDPTTVGWKRVAVRLDPIRFPGDTNYDDIVDFADLLVLAKHLGQSGNGNVFYETGDFNYDWVINSADVQIAGEHYVSPELFAEHWAHAQAVIPEPASLAIAAAVFASLSMGRRRSQS